jgi:hypothetical protein
MDGMTLVTAISLQTIKAALPDMSPRERNGLSMMAEPGEQILEI